MARTLTPDGFIAELEAMAGALGPGERRLVALVGPPASGKSTLADAIEARLNQRAGTLAVLGMDGFHYDDEVLVPRGWRPHKGAPHTFDVGGLAAILDRLRRNDEDAIAVPRFDRSIEIARAGARLIPCGVRIVLVEGNYLLFDEPPWDRLANCFELTAMIRLDEGELAERLRQRWVEFGMAPDAMARQIEDNDLPNGRAVYANSRPADVDIVEPPPA